MDVLPHSTDIFEGPTHKEAQEAVKTRVEVEECVEDIIREVQDILYLEIRSMQGECEQELWRRLADSGERVTGTCSCCLSDYYMVEQRCADTYEVPPDYLSVSWGGEVLCQSCQCDGKKCESCGVSEKLVKTHCDRNANFSLIEGTFPPQYLCTECVEIDDDLFRVTWTPEDLNRGFIDTEFEDTYRGNLRLTPKETRNYLMMKKPKQQKR